MSVLGDMHRKAQAALIPVAVHFDLTYRCHQRCLHCYLPEEIRRGAGGEPELDATQVKQVLDQLAAAGTFFLTFSGGEVFLRPDLLEIVSYARERNFAVALMTSGVRTAEAGLVRRLKSLGALNLYLTLFSLEAAIHDYLTQTPGSWAAAWETMRHCRDEGLPLVLNCVVMGPNYAGMWNLAEFVDREKIPLRWNYDLSPRWDGLPHRPELVLSAAQEQKLDAAFRDDATLEKTAENLGLSPDLHGCAAGDEVVAVNA